MTDPKHADGPWNVYHPGCSEWFIQTDDGLQFAQVFPDDLTVEEIEETAALFAAAPDTKAEHAAMLAALKQFVAACGMEFFELTLAKLTAQALIKKIESAGENQ